MSLLNIVISFYRFKILKHLEHYNFIGTRREEKKYIIISVLKATIKSEYTALKNSDNVSFFINNKNNKKKKKI